MPGGAMPGDVPGKIDGVAATRLATYGTLSPGEPNHHHLASLTGRWSRGTVHGRLVPTGWGASLGFPALVLDAAGPPVAVHLFESAELPLHWDRLDDFEGPGYRRVVTRVLTPDGAVDACLYEAVEETTGPA